MLVRKLDQGGKMKWWHLLRCGLNRHVPNARRVRWDGATYRGYCKHCAKDIGRISRGVWLSAESAEGSLRAQPRK